MEMVENTDNVEETVVEHQDRKPLKRKFCYYMDFFASKFKKNH